MTTPNDAVSLLREALLDAKFSLYGNGPCNPKMAFALSETANIQAAEVVPEPAQGKVGLPDPVGYRWAMHAWAITTSGKHRGIKHVFDAFPPPHSTTSSDDFISLDRLFTEEQMRACLLQSPAGVDAQRDAERYRWLRNLHRGFKHGELVISLAKQQPKPYQWKVDTLRGSDLDAAIDAAISAQAALKDQS